MNDLNKGNVVFKYQSEDFIVEEIDSEGKISKVSDSIKEFENAKVDLGSLDVNDKRDFLFFELEKLNIDHFSALSILCNLIGKQLYQIGYAGTKDKNSWSCQRISVFNPNIEKIKEFSYRGMILKNFRWGKHKIKIGDLKGNRFRITLRDADENAVKILSRVRNTKFIPNLFGMQRFGMRKDNFKIGRLILKRRYDEAIFTYLCGYGENESKETKDAKRRLKDEKNIIFAKEYFPLELKTEHKIIQHLINNKADYIGALELIGEKVLLIMCQSVQSRIFNDLLLKAMERGAIKLEDNMIIPGSNMNNSKSKLAKMERTILEENEIEISDFSNPDFSYLTLLGAKRKAFLEVKDLDVIVDKDELFEKSKKITLSFTLRSGSYATTLLEYFFDLR